MRLRDQQSTDAFNLEGLKGAIKLNKNRFVS